MATFGKEMQEKQNKRHNPGRRQEKKEKEMRRKKQWSSKTLL
jgi:hypothetical protein